VRMAFSMVSTGHGLTRVADISRTVAPAGEVVGGGFSDLCTDGRVQGRHRRTYKDETTIGSLAVREAGSRGSIR
jgi:hypothetical protein